MTPRMISPVPSFCCRPSSASQQLTSYPSQTSKDAESTPCMRSRCLAFTFPRKDWVSSQIPISGYVPPMVYSSQELGNHASFTLSSLLPLFPTLLLRATTSRYWCRHLPSGALKLFLRLCLFLYKVANSVFKGKRKCITPSFCSQNIHCSCCNGAQLQSQHSVGRG